MNEHQFDLLISLLRSSNKRPKLKMRNAAIINVAGSVTIYNPFIVIGAINGGGDFNNRSAGNVVIIDNPTNGQNTADFLASGLAANETLQNRTTSFVNRIPPNTVIGRRDGIDETNQLALDAPIMTATVQELTYGVVNDICVLIDVIAKYIPYDEYCPPQTISFPAFWRPIWLELE